MKVKKDLDIIALRYSSFRKCDFIDEHNKIIKAFGHTWMLKIGKPLSYMSINRVLEQSKCIVLKAPKKEGGLYYAAELLDIFEGQPKENMIHPEYYRLLQEEGYTLTGTWLKIRGLHGISDDTVNHFLLNKNNRKLSDVVNQTRTVSIYIHSDVDMEV